MGLPLVHGANWSPCVRPCILLRIDGRTKLFVAPFCPGFLHLPLPADGFVQGSLGSIRLAKNSAWATQLQQGVAVDPANITRWISLE